MATAHRNRRRQPARNDALRRAAGVVFAAWHGVRLGFVFAAVGALSAWAGGSIPHPGLEEPLWIEGLRAFLKLSAIAVGTRIALHQVRNRPST